ncbi:hypothetical protein CRYUN_Cryun22dG0102500 [Craigia yunnanensis]
MVKKERHFVLVHGACHGAWCWYKVATQLKSMSHKVTAIDMAASGIHPKQVHEIHSISDYFEPLMEFMASLPPEERVIIVGHSKGGFCISAAMERHVGVYKDEGSIKATAVTKEKYGLVHRVYIVCNKDNLIKEDFQRWMIENNPPDEVKLISGADHMVMFSKPKELSSCLQEIAEKYS